MPLSKIESASLETAITATDLTTTNGASIQGLTVGRGAGSVATNTAVGASALAANTTGAYNSAVGATSLPLNTTGDFNTAFGRASLFVNTTGGNNTAIGGNSLVGNTTGASNTAIGMQALGSNTTASNNTAVGYQAGYSNTTGVNNTIVGFQAGYSLTSGSYNVFVGPTTVGTVGACGALITTGSKNSILGGYNGNQGGLDIRTASNYIVLSDGDGNPRLYIDSNGGITQSATGATIVSVGVYNQTSASASNLGVASNGVIYRSTSALKYKQNIRDLEERDISLLRPVRYKSKCEGDDQTKDHFGLIADEAADAGFEELVTRGADGEVEGFQYERLTVVLLKELQMLRARVAQLESNP